MFSVETGCVGHELIFSLADDIGLFVLLLLDEKFPGLGSFLRSIQFDDSFIGEDPKAGGGPIKYHIWDEASFELFEVDNFFGDGAHDGDAVLEE